MKHDLFCSTFQHLDIIVRNRVLNTVLTIDKNLSLVFYQDETCIITAKRLSFCYDMGKSFTANTLMHLLMQHKMIHLKLMPDTPDFFSHQSGSCTLE